jgi:hypothetical protein
MTARARTPGILCAAAASLFGAVWAWTCGHRGFFGFDQSIVFDGGYRVLLGQAPYRDFLAPTGPVLFWLQGLVFRAAGVSYGSYVLLAALLNVLGTLTAWRLLRRWLPGRLGLPLLGTLLTALWLAPPFGTPWFETAGHVVILLMVAALAPGPSLRPGRYAAAAAGALAVCAYLTKQTVGIEAALFAAALLARPGDGRRTGRGDGAASFFAGAAAGALLMALWLLAAGDGAGAAFWRHTQEIPSALGRSRILSFDLVVKTGRLIVSDPLLWSAHAATLGGAAAGIAAMARRRREGAQGSVIPRLLVVLALASLFEMAVTENHAIIALPFVGISLALGIGQMRGPLRVPVGLVLGGLLLAVGMRAGWDRTVQDPVAGRPLAPPLRAAGLAHLRWQEGAPGEPSSEDFLALVAALRLEPIPFFVWPDHTILYGLCGVPSPQPLLWFHRGLTYPKGGDPRLEARLLRSLERAGVSRIVYETRSWHGTQERLADFPRLKAWIRERFRESESFGGFVLLEAIDGGGDGGAEGSQPRSGDQRR